MELKGIITAMATPLDANYRVDQQGVKQLVDKLIEGGVNGIFILGTNGEFYSMSADEKVRYAKAAVSAADGRVPVYVGTGAINTDDVIALTKEMEQTGVEAVSVITPFLLKLTQDELFYHYDKIAANTSLPIILYNIPKSTGNNIDPKTVARLAKIKNIIGIKDSSGNIENLKAYIDLTHDDNFDVLVGSDSLILKALGMGAKGAVAATSNVLTRTDVGIYHNYLEGNLGRAQELQDSINEYRRVLKLATLPAVLKYTLNATGQHVGNPFPPVLPLDNEQDKLEIDKVLVQYQAIEGF